MNRTNVALGMLVAIAIVALGLVVYEVVRGEQINPYVISLLSVVTTFIGASFAGAQAAQTALMIPPGHQLTPTTFTPPKITVNPPITMPLGSTETVKDVHA